MYLTDALGALLRHWYVVLLGVVVLAVGGWLTTRDVPTEYMSSGQLVLLLPPTSTGAETPTNPYLNAPAGLTTLASLISTEESTLDSARELAADGYGAKYSVSVLPGAGPVIAITAKGLDPDEVVATRDEVMRRLAVDLLAMQKESEYPENQLVYSRPSGDVGAEVLAGSRGRALIGLGVASGMATLLLVGLLERLRTWSVGRRADRESTQVAASPNQVQRPQLDDPRHPDLIGARGPGR
jgi:hypothetical protein